MMVFPDLPERAYHAYRDRLYSPEELFDVIDPAGPDSYRRYVDWRVYAGCKQAAGADEQLARRLHDHFIGEELRECLAGFPRVFAFMGGLDALRISGIYREVAVMARQLARSGLRVATGGDRG